MCIMLAATRLDIQPRLGTAIDRELNDHAKSDGGACAIQGRFPAETVSRASPIHAASATVGAARRMDLSRSCVRRTLVAALPVGAWSYAGNAVDGLVMLRQIVEGSTR